MRKLIFLENKNRQNKHQFQNNERSRSSLPTVNQQLPEYNKDLIPTPNKDTPIKQASHSSLKSLLDNTDEMKTYGKKIGRIGVLLLLQGMSLYHIMKNKDDLLELGSKLSDFKKSQNETFDEFKKRITDHFANVNYKFTTTSDNIHKITNAFLKMISGINETQKIEIGKAIERTLNPIKIPSDEFGTKPSIKKNT